MIKIELTPTEIYTIESIFTDEFNEKIAKIESPSLDIFHVSLDYCKHPKSLKANDKVSIIFLQDDNFYLEIKVLKEETKKQKEKSVELQRQLFRKKKSE